MTRKLILLSVIALCLTALVYISLSEDAGAPPALPRAPSGGPSGDLPPGHPPTGEGAGDNQPAPNIALFDIDGNQVNLASLKGKVVVVNFWSANCGPCIIEMPSFLKLAKAMQGKPFQILTITSDPKPMAQQAAEQLKIDVPVLLDTEGQAAMSYGVYFTPETFIIAPDQTVDQRIMGAANWSDGSVVDYMNKLIEKHSGKHSDS
jgi:peroxiredoxin